MCGGGVVILHLERFDLLYYKLKLSFMERKLFYEQPATEVVELKAEGVICQSLHDAIESTITNPFEELEEILL